MKKTLLAIAGLLTFGMGSVNAQLSDYSVAPDITFTDVNGNQHNLYSYLDQGYVVYMDLFAVWCAPCWNYHQNHQLEDLHTSYGPGGTDEVMVFGIEADPSTPESSIFGGGNSIGDWTQGITYTMANDDNVASLFNLAYYPTIYMISPNRLAVEIGQRTTADLYAATGESWVLGTATHANDGALITYTGPSLSLCGDIDVSVLMQNLGTSNLTSATIAVKENGATIGSYNWNGNLNTYATEEINVGLVSPSGTGTVTVEITSANDDTSNDVISVDAIDIVGNASAPYVQDNEDAADLGSLASGLYQNPSATRLVWTISGSDLTTPPADQLGGYGQSAKSLFFYCYNWGASSTGSVIMDKIDLTGVTYPRLTMSHAYAQYSSENDRLKVEVSTNCGASWTEVYNMAGADLATAPAVQGFFVPTASQWTTDTIMLDNYKDETELAIRITGVSDYGNNIYVDDINIAGAPASVNEVAELTGVKMFPNPANNNVALSLNLEQSEAVSIRISDAAGKVVYATVESMAAGQQNMDINLNDIETGIYMVEVVAGNKVAVEKLIIRK